jgi:hypothetical protein
VVGALLWLVVWYCTREQKPGTEKKNITVMKFGRFFTFKRITGRKAQKH